MLVSVTEPAKLGFTKRPAPPTARSINQFLIESTVLSGLGGRISVGIGVRLSNLGGIIAPTFVPYLGSTFRQLHPVVTASR
jgi:hypothetical protein